ncbi:MAG TPA: gliding motility-associated C-terminal domain-containing protein [Cyclobacteriaceae bacterium]|nr:gliding motility-associated C-terminal domain-containing protein [Cyclobacteriaceae bacterium]
MAKHLLIPIAFLFATAGHAQYLSEDGFFQVDEVSGCAPLTIEITPLAPCDAATPCYASYYGDGNFIEFSENFTYATPGTYWLTIIFSSAGHVTDRIQIDVRENTPPEFEIGLCTGNQVLYTITDTQYDEYVINFNDGSPEEVVPVGAPLGSHVFPAGNQAIQVRGRDLGSQDNCVNSSQDFVTYSILPTPLITTLVVMDESQIELDFIDRPQIQYKLEMSTNGTNAFEAIKDLRNAGGATTVADLDTENNYYCFRLGVFDPCNNTTSYSNVICSAKLSLKILDNINRLEWTTHPVGIDEYVVERDYSTYIEDLPNSQTSVNDSNIECKKEYSYRLISIYPNSESHSIIRSGIAISTTPPTPAQNITASVNNGSVDLTWAQDPAFDPVGYIISRNVAGSDFTEIGTSDVPAFTDGTYPADEPACYQVTYTDVCDNTSAPSITACPMLLTGEQLDDGSVQLNWNAYEGWALGVQGYIVEKYTDGGFLLDTFDAGTNTTLTDVTEDAIHQVHIYVVRATANEGGLDEAVSNVVVITRDPSITYPTAFTPNADGLNDRFIVHARFVNGFQLSIFNRWGELIYITNDITQGWDGTADGKVMPEGTYTFRADLIDYLGREFIETGAVLLLRKRSP